MLYQEFRATRRPEDFTGAFTATIVAVEGAEPEVHIHEADQRIRITDRILTTLPEGRLRHTHDEDAHCLLHIIGDNRTVVYRIVGMDWDEDQYLAEWPD